MSEGFRKAGPASALAMFEAEADGLNELRTAGEVRVPEVIDVGIENGQSYLVIEHLDLQRPSRDVERKFGQQLARLHRHTADRFGWFRDNTIGPTPQRNDWSDDWIDFFGELRLDFQVRLAARNGYDLTDEGARLRKRLPELFDAYEPVASLLHGDLWGGNWGAVNGEPVIFDPAVFHGDRESDIAMTMLFGGFGRAFYQAYEAEWPMAPGHERRIKLYQLYHVLNHLNLFGSSYLGRARQLLRELA
ncbi:MAG TPA: fructosamine kinase family protein [Woeseiaceae bacterium]|nr:fructosamine kinase family protein [Woeseiaceae bacterium]